jgi:polyhydroxyalkanoate synthesis repressor PhaR
MVEVRAKKSEPGEKVAVVKKYANRRLYNTATSSYVTLDDLGKMVRAGEHFVVYDAKTHEDLTRSILTQIILEEDSKGRNLLPINFLRQLISFYDDSLRAFLPRYLEVSMENFARNQEQIRSYIEGTLGRFFPMGPFEEMARQNMALFQRAATMFQPLPLSGEEAAAAAGGAEPGPAGGAESATGSQPEPPTDTSQEIKQLNEKIEALEKQLGDLVATNGKTTTASE